MDIEQAKGRQYPRQGVSTSYLSSFCDGNTSDRAYVAKRKKKGFRPPGDQLARSHIMIGAGAGVAPFRSFLMERRALLLGCQACDVTADVTWLVFGCRSFANDYLFEKEWSTFLSDGLLDRFEVCFSRDGNEKAGSIFGHLT